MKKIIFYFLIASITVFISCNNDDNETPPLDTSLIPGEWNLTATSVNNGALSVTESGITLTGTFTSVGKNLDYTVNFSDAETPKTFTSSGSYTNAVTASFLGQTVTEDIPLTNLLGSGEWRTEGNILYLSTNGVEQGSEITSITAERISLRVPFNEEIELDGTTFDTTGTLNITLEKN